MFDNPDPGKPTAKGPIMGKNNHTPAPAVRDSVALAELAEFARRAPHLDFGLARRRAILDALKRPALTLSTAQGTPDCFEHR